ncbi:GDSL-type esterase/lipase family protein [Phenylobacterium sp.]|uniref:GDSL-type esterase/lipase family protein n=1 Tax=Phenylobacterium sp. TaxID=1871053 RepID=UPI00120E642D|nr:GDSL-type esterase/lipase family protein [Phenylobacterium sp.]THD61274.1 MAG: GDSL family lipase [Phenylobacterium sp.]
MRYAFGLSAVLIALTACAAAAQPAAAPADRVDFGDTAMVAQPCLPMPKALADYLASPADAPLNAEAVKAYVAWNAWEQANDWPALCRYREENHAAMTEPRPAVVFMGDSITENWRHLDPAFFTQGRVGRGVSGQTTPQMVARFYQDVVALRPRVVHIMAGTNDIAGNTGPTSEEAFENNIAAMVDLARVNGIAVVLASIPPTDRFSWRPALKPGPEVVALNKWLAAYAQRRGLVFVDYTPVLATPTGAMRPELTGDGVHPKKAGYDLIEPLALRAIAQAERGTAARP